MDYWGAYALADGGRHQRLKGALFMQTAIPHPLFNSVILSDPDPEAIATALDLGAACAASGVPVLWRIGPCVDSAETRARLQGAGLEPSGSHPAMLVDLGELSAPPPVEGLTISMSTDAEERRAWGKLAIAAFEMEASLGTAMGACEATIPASLFADQPRFTGYLDGIPVAVSSLVMTDGIAGVYAVATLPEARKRGVGAAMTLHAMAEGKRRGAAVATLQATPMGQPVYEKIGFRTVFDYQTYLQS
ncbi:GNAT family N-acetyltransferase [Frigidibacter sp. RF13]|nr:GNAT family N-acetyltransferase [Frigidibacter sp. RF13]